MPWFVVALFLTTQKIPPLVLTSYLFNYSTTSFILLFFILASAAIGAIGGLAQTSLRVILAFSSVAHLSWLLRGILITNWNWVSYFLVYSFILISLISTLYPNSTNSINQIFSKLPFLTSIFISFIILSLGGLPPFIVFLPKLILVKSLIESPFFLLTLPLFLTSFVRLFFYSRVFSIGLIHPHSSNSFSLPLIYFRGILLTLNLRGLLILPFLTI